ncbi:MAG: PTS sugar transporter subunit IIA [Blautia sp.]
MAKSGKINDEEAYRKQVYAREEESTTGIGEGIAIPHGKCDAVDRPGLAAMV